MQFSKYPCSYGFAILQNLTHITVHHRLGHPREHLSVKRCFPASLKELHSCRFTSFLNACSGLSDFLNAFLLPAFTNLETVIGNPNSFNLLRW